MLLQRALTRGQASGSHVLDTDPLTENQPLTGSTSCTLVLESGIGMGPFVPYIIRICLYTPYFQGIKSGY
jgi:hypothetical protein